MKEGCPNSHWHEKHDSYLHKHPYLPHCKHRRHLPMRGPLHLLILKILTERPFSGSEIHEILKSKFELDIPSAAIYTILSALEERDLVSSRWETGERGPARKIYNVTEYGVEHLKNVIEEYKKFKRLFEFLIS